MKFPLIYVFFVVSFSCSVVNVEVSYAHLTVFDETVVYGTDRPGQESQRALTTICFARNGTLFANDEHNVYKIVDGEDFSVADIRPRKNSGKYYDLGSYYGITVAPNGTLYVSINNESYGWIYKVVQGEVFREKYVYKRPGRVKELAFNPDGELFYTDGESILSLTKGQLFTNDTVWKEKITISSITYAPDGTLFASVRYHYPKYDLIVKRVDDKWRLVYIRQVRTDRWGIDNIAFSPNGDLYFEDHDPYRGQLYKLVYKSQIPVKNEHFHLEPMYPVVSNSTILNYFYNYSAPELELNVTGAHGTHGVLILPIFRHNYPNGLQVQVEVNGTPTQSNMTETSAAYLVSLAYSHHNTTTLKIKLTSAKPYSLWQDIFTPHFLILLAGIIIAAGVSVIIYTRKNAQKKTQAKTQLFWRRVTT